jgi:peptidase C13-like protein/YcxB-like protein
VTDIDPVVIESVLTRGDWSALQAVWGERARARVGRLRLLAAVVLPLLAGGLLAVTLDSRGPYTALIVLGAVAASLTLSTRLFRRVSIPLEDGLILGRVRIELSPEGIRTERDRSTALTRWSALQGVTRTGTHLFLWVDAVSAYIVPLRDLPAGIDADAVVSRVASFAERPAAAIAKDGCPSVVAAASGEPATPATRCAFVAALVRRLAWRTVPESLAGSTEAVTVACGLAALGVWLAYDRYAAGADGEWYAGGVAGLAWYAGGVVALAWVLHRASGRTARFGPLLASIVGALPLALALGLVIQHWAPCWARGTAYALLAVAAVLHVTRALQFESGMRRPGALVAGAAAAALFAWGTSEAWVYPHLWFASEGEEDDGARSWAEGERLLFEQADRIDAAAGRLAAGRPGRPDVFFVGFAGVGEQKVFAEEVRLSERVVTKRYWAAGRSLLLVNDQRDREAWPLATVSGLERALLRLGERMDRDEDVLFLLLSSHGSAGPQLSVSNGTWPLSPLDGRRLRAALDAAGIRWRVIVISACHSGAFIEPLAGESTIVLTSAAADRTSFGCSDDRDVTDFGAAFVRNALPGADSLASAFEQAKRAIVEGERERGVEPSSPQASVGRAIETYWKQVEAERGSAR